MTFPRASGILLHPTSLPSCLGIGALGDEAYRFADFLAASGQSLWQVLPLGPTGYGDSPYACYSAFAGNTRLISPEQLVAEGLITEDDLNSAPDFPTDRVDFESVHQFKEALLRQAFARFQQTTDAEIRDAFTAFCSAQNEWLDDYALFRALKDAHGGRSWTEWGAPLISRDDKMLARSRADMHEQVEAQKFFQFLFFKQWFDLKTYCNQHGIRLIGDIPIFVALDSADVWTRPDQFKLDQKGRPTVVAGVPPDY